MARICDREDFEMTLAKSSPDESGRPSSAGSACTSAWPSRSTIAANVTFLARRLDARIERTPGSLRSVAKGSTPATTISWALVKMALASSSARAWLSARLTRARVARCSRLSATTTAATIEVTPRTCLLLMPSRTLLRSFRSQPQLVQLVVQRLEADAEDLGGARLVVARVLQRHHDQTPLGLFDRDAGRERHLRLLRGRRLFGQDRRQVLRLDERPLGDDGRSLDHVAKLADVARPCVLLEHAHRLLFDAGDRTLVAPVELVDERLDEQRQIFLALAQRRQPHREDIQTVIQVFAQLPLLDGVERLDVGRGDHADVDRLLRAPAD